MRGFERWSRKWLETEAKKRGIEQPETSTRTGLFRAIVEYDANAGSLRDQARKWLRSVFEAPSTLLKGLGSRAELVDRVPPYEPLQPFHSRATTAMDPSETPTQSFSPVGGSPKDAATHLELQRSGGELSLFWQISAQATQRANSLLGEPGELVLRVVSVRPHPTQVVQSEVSEHGPIAHSGAWKLVLPSNDAHCVGSIGMRHGERFISIVHQSSRAPR